MADAIRSALIAGEHAGSRYALTVPSHRPAGLVGAHLGHHAGASLEFKDHREYQPGDDLRRIDWSAYARSDRLHVKLYHEEVCPHLDLLIDASASMALTGTAKQAGALGVAAALAAAAAGAGFTHAAWFATDGREPPTRATGAPEQWVVPLFTGRVPLHETLAATPPGLRPRSIRVLVSDLLWMADPERVLVNLDPRGSMVVVVQLLAEADARPPARGSVRLLDSETGEHRDVFIDAAAQERYRHALARHQDAWQRACTAAGAAMVTLVAESLVERWDLEPLARAGLLRVR